MSTPWSFQGIERFSGLWTNKAGHVLFIEVGSKIEGLLVSFAPSKSGRPAGRSFFAKRPSIRMPGAWRENLGEVVVDLGKRGHEPWLHLTPEITGFYFEGPCLVPTISTDYFPHPRVEPDVSWLFPLGPYWRVDKAAWEEFRLVWHLGASST